MSRTVSAEFRFHGFLFLKFVMQEIKTRSERWVRVCVCAMCMSERSSTIQRDWTQKSICGYRGIFGYFQGPKQTNFR